MSKSLVSLNPSGCEDFHAASAGQKPTNACRKETSGERELAKALTALDYPAKHGQQRTGGEERPDVLCSSLAGFHIECGATATSQLNGSAGHEQARLDAGPDELLVNAHKGTGSPRGASTWMEARLADPAERRRGVGKVVELSASRQVLDGFNERHSGGLPEMGVTPLPDDCPVVSDGNALQNLTHRSPFLSQNQLALRLSQQRPYLAQDARSQGIHAAQGRQMPSRLPAGCLQKVSGAGGPPLTEGTLMTLTLPLPPSQSAASPTRTVPHGQLPGGRDRATRVERP